MSNYILKNDEMILRCANWAMELYHDQLKKIVNETDYASNTTLLNFIDKLDQNLYGRGCICIEITEFFKHDKNKLSINILRDLTNVIINRLKKSGEFNPEFIKLFEEFSNKLV